MCVITEISELVLMTAGVMAFFIAEYGVVKFVTYIRKNKKEK